MSYKVCCYFNLQCKTCLYKNGDEMTCFVESIETKEFYVMKVMRTCLNEEGIKRNVLCYYNVTR